VRQLAAILSVSDWLIANWLTYLLTIRLKLEIVPTREITTKISLVGGRGPIS